jgi:hypothetical protein
MTVFIVIQYIDTMVTNKLISKAEISHALSIMRCKVLLDSIDKKRRKVISVKMGNIFIESSQNLKLYHIIHLLYVNL